MALYEDKTYWIEWEDENPCNPRRWRLEIFFKVDTLLGPPRDCSSVELPCCFIKSCVLEGGWEKRAIGATKANVMSVEFDLRHLNNTPPEGRPEWLELKRRIQMGQNMDYPGSWSPCYTLFVNDKPDGTGTWTVEFQGLQRGRPTNEYHIENVGEANATYLFKADIVCVAKFVLEMQTGKLIAETFTEPNYTATHPTWFQRYTSSFDYYLNEVGGGSFGKDFVLAVTRVNDSKDTENFYQLNEFANLAALFHHVRSYSEFFYRSLMSDKGVLQDGCTTGAYLTFESQFGTQNGIDYTYPTATHPTLTGTFYTATPYDYIKFHEQQHSVASANIPYYENIPQNALTTKDLFFIARSGFVDISGTMHTSLGLLHVVQNDEQVSVGRDGVNNGWDFLANCSESSCLMRVRYDKSHHIAVDFLPLYVGTGTLTNTHDIDFSDIISDNNFVIRVNGVSISDAKAMVNGGHGDDITEHHYSRFGTEGEEDSSTRVCFHNQPDLCNSLSQMKQSAVVRFGNNTVAFEGYYSYGEDDPAWNDWSQLTYASYQYHVTQVFGKFFWETFWANYDGHSTMSLTNNEMGLWKVYYKKALPHINFGKYQSSQAPVPVVSEPAPVAQRERFIRPHSQIEYYAPNTIGAAVSGFRYYPDTNDAKIYAWDAITPPTNPEDTVQAWRALMKGQILFEQQEMSLPSQITRILHEYFRGTSEVEFSCVSSKISLNFLGDIFNFKNGASAMTINDLIVDDYFGGINIGRMRLVKCKINCLTGEANATFHTTL